MVKKTSLSRCIIVLSGRGCLQISDQPIERFHGSDLRSIAASECDVFAFTRGMVQTLSTTLEPMVLLSARSLSLSFDDPAQHRLPFERWLAADNPERLPHCIHFDSGGMLLICEW